MKMFFLALAVSLLSLNASADGWLHQYLQGSDGTAVNLDYQLQYVNGEGDVLIQMANPLWINVINPKFEGGNRVRAVVTNNCYLENAGARFASPSHQQIVDLNYAGGGRYTAQLQSEQAGRSDSGEVTLCFLRVAVVTDGVWMTDPLNGTHDFTTDLRLGH